MPKLFTKINPEDTINSPSLIINIPEVNLSKMTNSDGGISIKLNSSEDDNPAPRKRRPSSLSKMDAANSVSNAVTETSSKDSMIVHDVPYEVKYQETTGLLKQAIGQLDSILNDTLGDARNVRGAKTLARKYDILSYLQGNASNLIGNKISAIRAINTTIDKCNDLELKRMKDLNLANANENSDKKIMDMYNAFVTMPVGDTSNPQSLQYVTNAMNTGNVVTATMNGDDSGYQNYMNSMNPSQRLNMYESNPNVKQVVVYNQSDGSRYFEVMDLSTGQVIPGVDKHDAMFLDDVTLDLENKIARNINIGETYPIVIVGEAVMNMY